MSSVTTEPKAHVSSQVRNAREVRTKRVDRPLLEHAVNNHVSPGHVVVLCAEPGLYTEDVVTEAMAFADRRGASTYRYDYEGCQAESFCERIVHVVRRVNSATLSTGWAACAFENVPALDEVQVRRCVRAINRLLDRGGFVILTMVPEAYQLVEILPSASIFYADDLLLSDSSGTGSMLDDGGRMASGRIPHLACAILGSFGSDVPHMSRDYLDALGDLMAASMRGGLVGEETDIRMAMLLLGRGTFTDLADVARRDAHEYLVDLQRDAPLFGVDMKSETFSCIGLASDSVFEACTHVLRPYAAQRSQLCANVARLLFERARTRRASSVLALSADVMNLAEVGCTWFWDILDVGNVDLARNCLAASQRLLVVDPQERRLCELAMGLADGSTTEDDDLAEDISYGQNDSRRDAIRIALLAYAHLALRTGASDMPRLPAPERGDWLTERLSLHARVVQLLISGRFGMAYRRLLEADGGSDGTTFTGSLLKVDIAAARLFACDRDSGSFSADASCRVLARCNAVDFAVAQSLSRVAALVLGGATLRMTAYTSMAERSGLRVLQAGYLLLEALASVRRGEGVRSYVLVDHAKTLAGQVGVGWLEDAAMLLGWAVRDSMGEPVDARDMTEHSFATPFLSDVRQVMIAVARDSETARTSLSDLALDRNYLWLLVALSSGIDGFSQRFLHVMPTRWSAAVESVQASWVEAHGLLVEDGEAAQPHQVPAHMPVRALMKSGVTDTKVRITLLGRLTLSVDGRTVPDRLLNQRRLRAYLSYLASTPTHRVSLFQMIESVWPECDFEVGNQRLYTTTSALNRALKSVGYGQGIVERSRADASMALAMADVSVDVDEFEEAARMAIVSEGDDALVLAYAEQAELLYGGDLYVSQYDTGHFVSMRREELRRLYVDAMVAGAEAAIRTGSLRVATRLAERAACEDDLREDALTCMLEALVASGRVAEAQERYKRYAVRCTDVLHRAPSRKIQELVLHMGGRDTGTSAAGASEPEAMVS